MIVERRVWLAQCLCPQRHVIMARIGEADDRDEALRGVIDPLLQGIVNLLADDMIGCWCAICGATKDTWRVELSPTAFATIDEGLLLMQELQDEEC